jgi:hypothetical protein
MKFKNLSSKSLIWTYRKNFWFSILSLVVFLFMLPIAAGFMLDSMGSTDIVTLRAEFDYFLGYNESKWRSLLIIASTNITFFSGILAIIAAASSFSFLHYRKQVDFYHSVPIKRETLIVNQMIVNLGTIFLSYIIALLLTFILGAFRGVLTSNGIQAALWTFMINSLSIIVIYMTTVFAMMLTGKVVIGILGTGVFILLTPTITLIGMGLIDLFFIHLYNASDIFEFNWLLLFSPLTWNLRNIEVNIAVRILVQAIICIGLTGINIFVYKKRHLEAAGKALVTDRVFRIVKYIIMFISSFMVVLIFNFIHMENGKMWLIGVFIAIALISGAVMEIIYNADYKKMFVRFKDTVIVCVIGLCILWVLETDLFGIDKWQPTRNQLESISITSNYLDLIDDEDILIEPYIPVDDEIYILLETIWENDTNAVALLEGRYYSYGDVVIKYKLKSGIVITRQYFIDDIDDFHKEYSMLYDIREYREANYVNLLNDDKSDIKILTNNGNVETNLGNNMEVRKMLYEDLMEMDSAVLENQQQVATLRIRVSNQYPYVRDYPIYNGCKRMISYMENSGIGYDETIDKLEYESIKLEYYLDSKYDNSDYTIEMEDEINYHVNSKVVTLEKEEIKLLYPYILTYYLHPVKIISGEFDIYAEVVMPNGEIDEVWYYLDEKGEELAFQFYNKK